MSRSILLMVLLSLPFAGCATAVAQSKALDRVWEFETKRQLPQAVVVDAKDSRYIHVALKAGGLITLKSREASKPPAEVARIPIERFDRLEVMHLTQRDDLLYLALGNFFDAKGSPAGVAIVNVGDRERPKVVGVWKSENTIKGAAHIVVDSRYAYLGAMSEGVMIFDVSSPNKIQHLSTFQPEVDFPRPKPTRVQHPNARGLAIVGNRLYVAYDAGGLRVLDVSNRKNPKEIGRYANAAMLKKQQAYNNVVVEGDLVYAAVDYAGCEILNVADVRNIRQVGWWNPWGADRLDNLWLNSAGHTNQIEFDRKRKLVYLSAGDAELQVLDMTDPKQPKLVAHFGKEKDGRGVWGVTLHDSLAYLTYITAIIPFRSEWAGIVAIKVR